MRPRDTLLSPSFVYLTFVYLASVFLAPYPPAGTLIGRTRPLPFRREKTRVALLRCALALALLGLVPARASAAEADSPFIFDAVTATITVAADGSHVTDTELVIRIVPGAGLRAAQIPLSWSRSVERLEILEARIDKKDGRAIVLGKEAFQDDPPTGDRYFHEFSDESRTVLSFPDAREGDLLTIRTRREAFRPRVPGGFMTTVMLARTAGWEETNYILNLPAAMPLRVEARAFDHTSEARFDRVVHHLRSRQTTIPAAERAILDPFGRLPGFAVSTFPDWEAFGRAQASLLAPHAAVTPAIRAMAAALTAERKDAPEQARVLYEWVRDHVRYIPVPLQESGPDPRDADTVMETRYGDAKDHVVLLRALLTARGIPAEFVLLNATNGMTVTGPPNLRPMNHLILFLPALNLYADTTRGVAPFGVLPFPQYGKTVIHLDGPGPARREIPMPPAAATRSETHTAMTLGADGTLTGTSIVTARGAFGVALRGAARSFTEGSPAAAAVSLLRRQGTPGTGDFALDAPASPGPDHTMRTTFRLENLGGVLLGGSFAPWTGPVVLPRPGDFLAGPVFMRGLAVEEPTFCYPGTQYEALSLTIPEGRVLSTPPRDTAIETELVRYHARWVVDGRHVTVTRIFESDLSGPLCEGPVREEMTEVLARIRADLTHQISIQMDAPPPMPEEW